MNQRIRNKYIRRCIPCKHLDECACAGDIGFSVQWDEYSCPVKWLSHAHYYPCSCKAYQPSKKHAQFYKKYHTL